MGMLLHRHFVTATPVSKPVKAEVAETVVEVPKEETKQAVVEEKKVAERKAPAKKRAAGRPRTKK